MKKSIFTLTAAVFVAGTILTSCSSSSEKVDNAETNVEEAAIDLEKAKVEYTNEYNQFKLESDNRIAANERDIAVLKEENKKMKKEVKEANEQRIKELEERNEALKVKMNDYKNDEKNEKWESFKREFNHDMDELGQSLKDLTKNNTN